MTSRVARVGLVLIIKYKYGMSICSVIGLPDGLDAGCRYHHFFLRLSQSPLYLEKSNRSGAPGRSVETIWSFSPCLESTGEIKTLPSIIHVDELMEKCSDNCSNKSKGYESIGSIAGWSKVDLGIMSRFISRFCQTAAEKKYLYPNVKPKILTLVLLTRLGFMNLIEDDMYYGSSIFAK